MILAATIFALLASAPGPEKVEGIPATFIRIKDGDTFVVLVHLPFDVHITKTIRLEGIDCPEKRGLQARAGLRAKEFTETWAAAYPDMLVQDTGRESFGRAVSTVCPVGGGKCLTEALREAGHFKVNEKLGRKRKR